MYHIKADRRCQKSAQRIADAFSELLEDKPFSDITVTDIQKRSDTGRSTFYRLFDNTDDVLLYLAEKEFSGTMERFRELSLPELSGDIIKSVILESRSLMNIASSGKMHILSAALRHALTREAEADNYIFDNTSRYMISLFVGGCISLVNTWNENGREESLNELVQLMQQAYDFEKIERALTRPVE